MKKITRIFSQYFPITTEWARYIVNGNPDWLLRKEILEYYQSIPDSEINSEIREAIDYIRKKGIKVFPYSYSEKYKPKDIKVIYDASNQLHYVMHNEYRLYFSQNLSPRDIQNVYTSLLIEQDIESPHCYRSETFGIDNGDILFDIGAAEGILTLSSIDKIKKGYVFEAEERWLKALNATFSPWKDKIEIIHKYVSNTDSDQTIKIDTITQNMSDKSLYLKLDVEGAEKLVIEGAENTLKSNNFNIKTAVCTYHNQEDYEVLSKLMTDLGYDIKTTNGYMIFKWQKLKLEPPYLRRGLIQCCKSKE